MFVFLNLYNLYYYHIPTRSSQAIRRRPLPNVLATARPACWSPPMASGVAKNSSTSRPSVTRASSRQPNSVTWSQNALWSPIWNGSHLASLLNPHHPPPQLLPTNGLMIVISGGTTRWMTPIHHATLNGWRLKIRCLCCTQVDRLASQRVCCTRLPDICCMQRPHSNWCLTTNRMIFIGARLTLAGSPDIPTAFMDRWRMLQQQSWYVFTYCARIGCVVMWCCVWLQFEGTPFYPANDRFWSVVEKYKVTQFYTAPTAIRALMRFGDDPVKKHNLSSLRYDTSES